MYLMLLLTCLIQMIALSSGSLARGFNDDIDWVSHEDGLKTIESDKPRMVLIHKSWCGACKQLKPQFATSKKIVEKSKDFVMINVEDDEEEKLTEEFSKVGKYIPRIVFTDSKGNVQAQIKNELGNEKYPYFYTDESQVIAGMEAALKELQKSEAPVGGEL